MIAAENKASGKYQPYPEYKDSGITRLGPIPSHWQPKKLKRIASIENGRDYKHVEATEGFPVIGSGGQFTWAEQYLYSGESVLLGRKGTVDKPLYIKGSFWTVDTMFYTKVGKTIPAKFLYYAALTIEFGLYSTNTALPSMTQEDLGNIHFGSPSYDEAENIAAFLDYETARIDRLIAQQQRLIELLKEKRQAVISHAVTKGLNPDAPMKDSGVEWLGQVPEHWNALKFNHCANIRNGQVDPTIAPYNDYILIAPNHIESGTGRLLEMQTAQEQGADSGKYICKQGEVIYSKIRPALVKACLSPEKHVICSADMYPICGKNGLENEYLLWFLLSDSFTRFAVNQADRVAMPKINRDSLSECRIPVPPKAEQVEIVNVLNRKTGMLDNVIEKSTKAILFMQERRTALISAAVTGKIDLRGWKMGSSQHHEFTGGSK